MENGKAKTVLITGASGNVGRAAVRKFIDEGYQVIATVSPRKNLGYQVSGQVEVMETDLSDESMTRSLIDYIVEKYGTLNAALLLAGGYAGGSIKSADESQLDKMISLNFKTGYHAARFAFMQMKKQDHGGKIILVGARAAIKPEEGKKSLAYSLSKSLIFHLAEYLNAEGASSGVVTSVIVPGTIDTPQNREDMPSADFDKWVHPDEIAGVMAFICSSKADALRDPVISMYGRS